MRSSDTPSRRPGSDSLRRCRSTGNAAELWGIPTEGTADSTLGKMAVVRLFAAARDAAGTGRDELPGDTVSEVLARARQRYGDGFDAVLATSRVWVNGEPADSDDPIGSADELAVLPPVSGG